jgi:phosphoribosylaminoimidazole carboxylase
LLINEIAPRPHNSGHYTIEACATSQYEAHLRAILNLPFSESNTLLQTPSTCSIMLNILGTEDPQSYLQVAKQALTIPGATVHLYGKKESRPGRKLGHITIVAGSMSEAEFRLSQLLGPQQVQQPLFSPALGRREIRPVVAVIMGSDSDLPTMRGAAEMLEKFGVPKEVTIVSAHRTPDRMVRYAREARSRGFKVIIAGAGGAAHLPGMVASETTLPVIGVPVRGSTCEGQDSLLSIVQMPVSGPPSFLICTFTYF